MSQESLADRTEVMKLAADDARHRFEVGDRRLEDFRGRARGLAVAVGAALALEFNVAASLLEGASEVQPAAPLPIPRISWQFLCFGCAVIAFGTAFSYQVALLGKLVRLGYGTKTVWTQPRPTDVATLASKAPPSLEFHTALLNSYASAAEDREELGFDIARQTARVGREFAATMWILLFVLTAIFARAFLRGLGVP